MFGYLQDWPWWMSFPLQFVVCLPWYMAGGRLYVYSAYRLAMLIKRYKVTDADRERFIDDHYMRVRPLALSWGAPCAFVFSYLFAEDWTDYIAGNIFTVILTFAIWKIKKKKPPKKRHLAGALARIKDLGGRLVVVPLPAPT